MVNMIFYHPAEITYGGTSGSQVRPVRILDAFKNIGCNVVEVTGLYHKRREKIRDKIIGKKFDLFYGENSNMPLLLSNKYKLPWVGIFDKLLFEYIKENSIPSGLFFRDIYWV